MSTKEILNFYPVYESPDSGRIRVDLSPDAKKTKNAVYAFFNPENGRSYTGKTSHLGKRIQKHESDINGSSSSEFHQAVRENPQDFCLCVLYTAANESDLDDLERQAIEEAGGKENTYNRNRGGGGGSSYIETQDILTSEESLDTPKFYPIYKDDNDRIQIDWTPSGEKSKMVVYAVINSDSEVVYIGKTEQEARKRLSVHIHEANHPEKPRGQQPLPKTIRKNPGSFTVAILDQANNSDDLSSLEKEYIQEFRGESLNGNGGGGGPCSAAKRLNFDTASTN